VVQEQHPDRTRLYRQWKALEWPIFVDSLNVLDVRVVPIPILLDEQGIVRHTKARPGQLKKTFVHAEYEGPVLAEGFNVAPEPGLTELDERNAWFDLGVARFHMGDAAMLDETVSAFDKSPQSARTHFGLGAAMRKRYESAYREEGDAQAAVEHWGKALALDPNNYIYRRRLQQYGPRLDKPYNIYFWVAQARAEIIARGETPHPLPVEPMGSELAAPAKVGVDGSNDAVAENPDPKAKINRDTFGLVEIDTIVTPAEVRPGRRVQVRMNFRLREDDRPYWNNEADHLVVWLDPPPGVTLKSQLLRFQNRKDPETQELRTVEAELGLGADLEAGSITIPGYALYYVCEDAGGVCYFLRNDFELKFEVNPGAPILLR